YLVKQSGLTIPIQSHLAHVTELTIFKQDKGTHVTLLFWQVRVLVTFKTDHVVTATHHGSAAGELIALHFAALLMRRPCIWCLQVAEDEHCNVQVLSQSGQSLGDSLQDSVGLSGRDAIGEVGNGINEHSLTSLCRSIGNVCLQMIPCNVLVNVQKLNLVANYFGGTVIRFIVKLNLRIVEELAFHLAKKKLPRFLVSFFRLGHEHRPVVFHNQVLGNSVD